MPPGDAQRQWFPEMIEMLRQQWDPKLSWDELALLATRLDATLQQIRKDRNITPPMFICPECGVHQRASFGRISINATIMAVGRFGIASQSEVKKLSTCWKKYRREHGLDNYGGKADTTTAY